MSTHLFPKLGRSKYPQGRQNSRLSRAGKVPFVTQSLVGKKLDLAPAGGKVEREATAAGQTAVDPKASLEGLPRLTKPTPAAPPVAPGGRVLPESTRALFAKRLGGDFSEVRVHTDGFADDLARSAGARALTLGQDVFFRSGHFRLSDSTGQRTLAHELWHTQQPQRSKNELRLERASDFDEMTYLDPRFEFYFERALDGKLVDECELIFLAPYELSELEYEVRRIRDNHAVMGATYARLDILLSAVQSAIANIDKLEKSCPPVQGPPIDAKPAKSEKPRKQKASESPLDVNAPTRQPATSQPLPQSYISDSHRAVYMTVRAGDVPMFDYVHHVVVYERGGQSWGFADDLIAIAHESGEAKVAAYHVLQGLVDAGYREYNYKIERFLDEGLLTQTELVQLSRSAPDWPNVEFQDSVGRRLGGEELVKPQADAEADKPQPEADKPKSRRILKFPVDGLAASETVELASLSRAGLKVTLSATPRLSVKQEDSFTSVSGTQSGDTKSVSGQLETDKGSLSVSHEEGADSSRSSVKAKVKGEELLGDQLGKAITNLSISVSDKGLPTLGIETGAVGGATSEYSFDGAKVTGKFTLPSLEEQVEIAGQTWNIKGSLVLTVSIEPDPDIGKLSSHGQASRSLSLAEGALAAGAIVAICTLVVLAPATGGGSLAAVPAVAGVALMVEAEED